MAMKNRCALEQEGLMQSGKGMRTAAMRASVAMSVLCVVCLLAASPASPPTVDVYFSPKGGCTDAIVRELGSAKREIRVQAYSFTSTDIAQAIAKAHERGVNVVVVLDKSHRTEKYSGATYLSDHQIPTCIDAKHAIAHNKIMVIDGATVITGSFNFTKAAEEDNAENLLIIRSSDLAAKYLQNFAQHLQHAQPYSRKQGY
jgi:phosphatidylserine/phosphatidylglycerophosphate/cardiolipin synthase-like enzyme